MIRDDHGPLLFFEFLLASHAVPYRRRRQGRRSGMGSPPHRHRNHDLDTPQGVLRSWIRSTRRAVSRSSTARSLRREANSFSSGHLREISGDIRGDRNAESSRSIIHRNAAN